MYDYVTRDQWGAAHRPDRAVAITARTEYFIHHFVVGPMDHSKCDDYMRRIEEQHNDQWGYSIGYNEAICQHLTFYEGCGRDRRGQHCPRHNTSGVSLSFMGDGRNPLPDGLVAAMRWRWDLTSNAAGRRLALYPHRRFRSTTCPGDVLNHEVERGLVVPDQPSVPIPSPLPPEADGMTVQNNPVVARGSNGHYARIAQSLLVAHAEDLVPNANTFIDGAFGNMSADVLAKWQARTGYLVPDGVCGPATWKHLCGET